MSKNPHQRKPYSLEKLSDLRDKVRQAYKVSKGEELQTPKNKNSVYYTELKNDISSKVILGLVISEGTLVKFFCEDIKRSYQVIIIESIEEYVTNILLPQTVEKDISHSNVNISSSNEKNEEKIRMFANSLYIELTTRKASIPIDEDTDVIEEIYNSWYKLFCVIRDELKTVPIHYSKDNNQETVISLAMKILNEVLRPHLTEHQAKYRNWLEKAKQNPKYKNMYPQELQRNYPDYNALMKSLKETNKMLIGCTEKLS